MNGERLLFLAEKHQSFQSSKSITEHARMAHGVNAKHLYDIYTMLDQRTYF